METNNVTTVYEFIVVVRKKMKNQNITQKKLSELSGVPVPTLNKLLAGVTKAPRKETIDKIGAAMEVSTDSIQLYDSRNQLTRFLNSKSLSKEEFEITLEKCMKKMEESQNSLNDALALIQILKFHSEIEDESE